MRTLHLLAMASALALAGCHTLPTLLVPEDESQAPAEVLLYSDSSRMDELGRMAATLTLNDQGPFHFLLDTGATHSVITQRTAARLNLTEDPISDVMIRGVNGSLRAPTTLISTLSAGALQLHNLRTPILSGAVLGELDGILGMNALAGMKVTADFARQQIRISEANGQPAADGLEVVEFDHLSQRLVRVDGRIGRTKVNIVVDTGGAHTLGNPALLKALLRETRSYPGDLGTTRVVDATDTSWPALYARVPLVRMDSIGIRNLEITFGEFPVFKTWGIDDRPSLLLGTDALRLMGEVTFDYRRKELHIGLASAKSPDTAMP